MNYVAQFVVPGLGSEPASREIVLYLSLFEAAVAEEIPPYFRKDYGESFRRHIESPVWVIQCLISNAIKEGEGSRDLASVANACADGALQAQLVGHVNDEARHCRLYLQLIDLVFPAALPERVHAEVRKQLPSLAHRIEPAPPIDSRQLLDYLIQINLGEVRTRVHQQLLEPVLHAYCPEANREKLRLALEWLSSDEARHIQYTAQRIGELSQRENAGDAKALFVSRSKDFNAYTERELGSQREGLFDTSLVRESC